MSLSFFPEVFVSALRLFFLPWVFFFCRGPPYLQQYLWLFYRCWLHSQLSYPLKMSRFSLKKNWYNYGQTICWRSAQPLPFKILKSLEYKFLKTILVQGRQQSFWKFSILSNVLDLQSCLSNKIRNFILNCPPCLLADWWQRRRAT